MKLKSILVSISMLLCTVALAQQQAPQTPEEKEKQLLETIDAQLEKMTESLDLNDWQIFYIDSLMVHDYKAMTADLDELGKNKVGNVDLYYKVQDEWSEKMYQALKGILDEDQWTKYQKQGAARAKKARDKRMAKWNN